MGTSWVGLKPQFIVEFLNPPDKSGGNCFYIIQSKILKAMILLDVIKLLE
jgi:hypothetical protein